MASESSRPEGEGKHNPEPSRNSPAFRSTASAARANGDAMLALRLHPLRRDAPGRRLLVYLGPPCAPDFPGAAGSEHQEFERERGRRVGTGRPHLRHRRAHVRIGERRLMLPPDSVLRECCADGVTCGVVLAVALRNRPLHDRADPLPDPSRRLPLRAPDREEDGHHVRRCDSVHRQRSEFRQCVGRET